MLKGSVRLLSGCRRVLPMISLNPQFNRRRGVPKRQDCRFSRSAWHLGIRCRDCTRRIFALQQRGPKGRLLLSLVDAYKDLEQLWGYGLSWHRQTRTPQSSQAHLGLCSASGRRTAGGCRRRFASASELPFGRRSAFW